MKEVTVKQENKLAAAESIEAWGMRSEMTSQDLVIPKILPINMMSKKLKEKTAAYGELRDTSNNKLLGDLSKGMEIVPFMMEKYFVESTVDQKTGKKEFKRILPIISDPTNPGYNDELKYEEIIDGEKISRDRVLSFYVLIPSEIDSTLAESGGGTLPYVLPFRRTSLRGGKKIATQMFAMNAAARKSPAAMVMSVKPVDTTNDDGSYVVLDVNASRASTKEEQQAAFYWYKAISKGGMKVDHGDLQEDAVATAKGAEEPTEF